MGRLILGVVICVVVWAIAYMHKNSKQAEIEQEKAFWNRRKHHDTDRIEELEQEVAELNAKLNNRQEDK